MRKARSKLLAAILLAMTGGTPQPEPDGKPLELFDVARLREERAERGGPYLPFLDRKTLSCGLYELKAGARDGQSPHDRDEVYHVLSGRVPAPEPDGGQED